LFPPDPESSSIYWKILALDDPYIRNSID